MHPCRAGGRLWTSNQHQDRDNESMSYTLVPAATALCGHLVGLVGALVLSDVVAGIGHASPGLLYTNVKKQTNKKEKRSAYRWLGIARAAVSISDIFVLSSPLVASIYLMEVSQSNGANK
jgi:hypothetical protein